MSKETRDALVKQLATQAEDTRGHIRQHRQDARKRLPKDLPSSEQKRLEREIQDAHDRLIREVDRIVQQKSRDIQAA
jgi:ribosome recycling factor